MPSKPGKRKLARVYHQIPKPPPGTEVVGYVRYSSEMQDTDSIVTQEREIMVDAHKDGWVVAHFYEEPEQSAKYEEVSKRPVFSRMLEDARTGKIKAIICYRNNRWSRNSGITHTTLDQLRRLGVWWQTVDQGFTINNIQEAGPGIFHAIDTKMSESYIIELSKTTADGKLTRALNGFHASHVPFGYLPPDYPQRPPTAPANWTPDPAPVRPDYEGDWKGLQLIADLRLKKYSAREIAHALNQAGFRSTGRKHHGPVHKVTGEHTAPMKRLFNEDSVRYILINPFYREFEPGCGKGTVTTSDGQQVKGLHEAAFDWETWHKLDEVASELYRGSNATATARFAYPFGGVITCSVCRELMRCMKMRGEYTVRTYYTCFTQNRGLPCSASVRSTPGHIVEEVFGDLLRRYQLGDSWRTDLLHLLEQQTTSNYWEEIESTRRNFEAEKKKLNVMFRAGGIETEEYEREMQGVNARLAQLPKPEERERYKARALEAGEVLASLSECWDAAQRDQNFALLGEYVNSMLRAGGLIWHAEKRAIQALRPHPEYVPVLLLVMGKEWKQDGEYLVCEQPMEYRAAEKKWPMTPEQGQQIEQLHNQGMSVRGIAEALGIGRMTVQRYLKWCEGSQE